MIQGDSNTKEILFGEGSGKVGASYPGKRVKCAKVRNIDPQKCIGYENIFLACGTNDLRCDSVNCENDVYELVEELRSKLRVVKQLCPKSKVFVMPVLPSRIRAMNTNIMLYNSTVSAMLFRYFPDIWFRDVSCFLDNQSLLSSKLTRNNDCIHLGPRGIAKYVTLVKRCVYEREKIEQYKGNHKQKSANSTRGPPGP